MSPSDSPERDLARPSSDEPAPEPAQPSTPPSPPRWSKGMRRPMFDLTPEEEAELLAEYHRLEAEAYRRFEEGDKGEVTIVVRPPKLQRRTTSD